MRLLRIVYLLRKSSRVQWWLYLEHFWVRYLMTFNGFGGCFALSSRLSGKNVQEIEASSISIVILLNALKRTGQAWSPAYRSSTLDIYSTHYIVFYCTYNNFKLNTSPLNQFSSLSIKLNGDASSLPPSSQLTHPPRCGEDEIPSFMCTRMVLNEERSRYYLARPGGSQGPDCVFAVTPEGCAGIKGSSVQDTVAAKTASDGWTSLAI